MKRLEAISRTFFATEDPERNGIAVAIFYDEIVFHTQARQLDGFFVGAGTICK